ncbi:MAG: SMP-30/gluconolactonase/LRE family protein [Anaerolineae bacterium]|nr:SMP-30/gluconolactonase/LRE family protein [Anaerolineae bacterium]
MLLGTLFWVYRDDVGQINWAQVGIILLIALIVCFTFVVMEELSHTEPTSTEQPADPLDPDADAETSEPTSLIRWSPMIALWGLTAGGFVFLFFTRRKDDLNGIRDKDKYGRGFWGTMDLFPEFDVIIIIGTLILPWATAIFPFAMGGTEGDFANIASSLPSFMTSFIGTYVPAVGGVGDMTQTQLAQVGRFWLNIMAFIPLFALMSGIGLMWNWKRWLIASAIFHGLFAFFFTTVFTNVVGLGTGWVYSLGYWLEQQGVRRGSQPQYYYLLVIMPFYEFLPVIGSVLAMFAGTTLFWRQTKKSADVKREVNTLTRLAMIWRNDTEELEIEAVSEDGELADDFNLQAEIASAKAQVQSANDEAELPPLAKAYDDANGRLRRYGMTVEKAISDPQQRWRRLEGIPFLMFFSWLAVLNLVGYSLAGEKMPWLGTHLTMPMIFLTAWFFGRIIDDIDWELFKNRGWEVRIALGVFIIGLFRSIAPLVMGTRPFSGLAQHQLQATYGWLSAVIVTGIALSVVIYYVDTVGWKHVRQMVAVSIFLILSIISFRSAWMASFINFDYASEFLVYAHAAPGVKWVLEDIEELSERITDGNELRIAYDNEVSWPYSWYFRNFDNVIYVGENPTVQNLDDAVVIVVGAANRSKVEPIVEDRYVRFDYMRLWWPMQDYFNLTPARISGTFDLSPSNTQAAQVRQGIFEIWWNRDYTTYGNALERDFSAENWPVSDRMHFYVRKDFAAQIWEYGIGEGGVTNPLNEIEQNQCTANWQPISAITSFTAPDGLSHPIGLDISADNTLYVAEEFGHRISTFNTDGTYLGSFGVQGLTFENGVAFTRPNSIDIGADGNLYIADTWNYRVQILTPNLEPITLFGQAYTGGFDSVTNPVDGFWGPRDVTVSNDGLIYVADTGNKRVRAYRIIDGVAQFQFDVGEGGSGLGQLDEPSGLVVNPADGRLYVADTWNRRISVFTAEGVFLDSYRVRGWYEEQGNRPYLAIDSERELLYVTDPDSGRVLVYTTGGDCVGSFGQAAGTSPTLGQFGIATGITVDSEGFVYIADSELNRVLKFEPFTFIPVPEEVPDEAPEEADAEVGNDVESNENDASE